LRGAPKGTAKNAEGWDGGGTYRWVGVVMPASIRRSSSATEDGNAVGGCTMPVYFDAEYARLNMYSGECMRGLIRGCAVCGMLVALVFWAGEAAACIIQVQEHKLDPEEQEHDSTPPGMVEILSTKVHRGEGPNCEGPCAYSQRSCDGMGNFVIEIVPPVDDRTPADQMGYRIDYLEGETGMDIIQPDLDRRANDGQLWVHWSDGDTDDQEPIDLTITISAVDLGGNVGPASEVIHILHPGSAGCSAAGMPSIEFGLFVAFLVFLKRKRL